MKKKRWMVCIILLVFAALLATAVYAGDTYHWLLQDGDDAYVLCADGQFTIRVNGDDSIYLICHSPANRPEGVRDDATD